MFVPENSVICTSCNSQRSKTVAPKGRKGKTSRETTEAIFLWGREDITKKILSYIKVEVTELECVGKGQTVRLIGRISPVMKQSLDVFGLKSDLVISAAHHLLFPWQGDRCAHWSLCHQNSCFLCHLLMKSDFFLRDESLFSSELDVRRKWRPPPKKKQLHMLYLSLLCYVWNESVPIGGGRGNKRET